MGKRKSLVLVLIGMVAIVIGLFVAYILIGKEKDDETVAYAEYMNVYCETYGEFAAETASLCLKERKTNTCYSPLSLFAALSLTAEVTEGKTQQEILNCLGVKSVDDLEEKYEQMLGSIDINTEESKITLANSFWTTTSDVTEETKMVIDRITGELDGEAFLREGEKNEEINAWVDKKTNGLIKKIIDEDMQYSFMLVNTLYYKSMWRTNVKEMKSKQIFCLENGDVEKVDFLEIEQSKLQYKQAENYTFVEVPLIEGKAILVLPKKEDKIEKLINEDVLNDVLATATSGEGKEEGVVHMRFPKVNIGYGISPDDMEYVLKEKGINALFEMPKFVNGLGGSLTKIIQKTQFIMNEEGIEAAAATAVAPSYGVNLKQEIDLDITFDRPFLYILMKDEVPLFIGTVYNPAE